MKTPFSRIFGLGDKEEPVSPEALEQKEEVRQIEIHQIQPNRFQPRTIFDDEKIEELARTIHTHGIIQPIIIRESGDGQFEIIAGERRWRAMKSLGWEKVPAIVKNMSDTETASVALIENLQREELSPVEEAMAYQKLLDLHQLTQEALAQRLGKGQSTVANKLRLLKLPEEVLQVLTRKLITERHARALIPLKDQELQVKLLDEVVEQQLNVKQTETRVQKLLESPEKKAKPKKRAFNKDVRIAVNTIRQSLNMISDSGMKLDSEEEEFDDYYKITIKLPKKKK
ncbi:nucleoid occlusion protein [Jeotgalibacillus campisalis]|uniref:Nucleoid occlusion protein n=1 Tax=Jeotgalibacillus campisalis TaxID=220754 RepID=A0A0C2RSH8_9BACL|nr:nucleoid occlusion protein [Jeotgalibacillus campisalis]KIL53190.1 chromosome partitioning protein ParB [Jeotgalibacillus campisalis]